MSSYFLLEHKPQSQKSTQAHGGSLEHSVKQTGKEA
jgi:hypothetical protein